MKGFLLRKQFVVIGGRMPNGWLVGCGELAKELVSAAPRRGRGRPFDRAAHGSG